MEYKKSQQLNFMTFINTKFFQRLFNNKHGCFDFQYASTSWFRKFIKLNINSNLKLN